MDDIDPVGVVRETQRPPLCPLALGLVALHVSAAGRYVSPCGACSIHAADDPILLALLTVTGDNREASSIAAHIH